MRVASIAIGLLLIPGLALAQQETYKIDDAHSFANWTIRHVASKASGTFPDIKGTLVIDRDNLQNSSVDARINVLSVNSSHAKRDDHIRKDDYLDAYNFGEATFISTKVKPTGPDEGIITGDFTLHGVTKQISFPFKVLGFDTDPLGRLPHRHRSQNLDKRFRLRLQVDEQAQGLGGRRSGHHTADRGRACGSQRQARRQQIESMTAKETHD